MGETVPKEEDEKEKKPFLQMTDQYATLFPHLASLRAQQPESPSSSPFPHGSSEPAAGPISNIISSASFISEIVESTIIKSQSDPEEKETKDATVADADLDENKDDEKESLTPS